MREKLYADRDLMAMDEAGNYYCNHVGAMTDENLHSKSDIAAELGYRDMHIAELEARNKALEERLKYAAETFDFLDNHTHPEIECDASAAACRELLDKGE